MNRLRLKRHMSAAEITMTADWIIGRADLPSWPEIRAFVLKEFGIERAVEALRRIPDLKQARAAKAVAPRQRALGPRPTTRKIEALQTHIARLEAEVERLESENLTLLERNLRLINGARVRQIPECDLDRPLAPINRNPTTLRTRGGRT